jgi:predicted PurR-regulated permease PerM
MSAPNPHTPSSDREFIERGLRWGMIGIGVVATILALLWLLKSALTPFAIAFALAYLFDPVIDRFEARRVGRRLAIFLLLGLAGALCFAFAFLVVPRMQREVAALSEALPGYVDAVLLQLAPALERLLGFEMPHSVREGLEALRSGRFELPLEAARELLGRAVSTVTGTLGALVGLIVVPVIAYYLLAEFDEIKRWILAMVPEAHRTAVARRASTIDDLLSGFLRGQLLVCLVLGVLYASGFAIIGIDSAVLIGFFAAVLAIIPYVGSAVALVAASAMCLLQFGLDIHLALVVGWYAVVQTLEGLVLTPRIVGGSMGMHPVTVIAALLIGGDLLGFLGLLVAVPLAAVVQVFARDALDAYRGSSLYGGASPGGAPPAGEPPEA